MDVTNLWAMPEKDAPTVFVDVDGTLLLWRTGVAGESQPVVNVTLCAKLRRLKEDGYRVGVWTYGGEEHARRAAAYCEITDIVDWYMGKPTLIIDDAPHRLWERAQKQSPSGEAVVPRSTCRHTAMPGVGHGFKLCDGCGGCWWCGAPDGGAEHAPPPPQLRQPHPLGGGEFR